MDMNFLIKKNICMTDIWRSKEEGKNLLCDFDFMKPKKKVILDFSLS